MRLGTIVDTVERSITGLHKAAFNATGGRGLFGWTGVMPDVMLTTTGRKSGKQRTTMLTAPIVDGDTVVLVASRGGAPEHPDWYLNLSANADVELTLHGTTRQMRARTATNDEKAVLWPRIVRRFPSYWLYQLRTSRDIPVVIIEPRT